MTNIGEEHRDGIEVGVGRLLGGVALFFKFTTLFDTSQLSLLFVQFEQEGPFSSHCESISRR